MFSEVTEAACEECVNNDASTDEDHSQLSSSLEKELTEVDYGDIFTLTVADIPGASLNNKDPSDCMARLSWSTAYRKEA